MTTTPQEARAPGIAFSDRVAEVFLAVHGPASDAVMDSLRLAAAQAYADLLERQARENALVELTREGERLGLYESAERQAQPVAPFWYAVVSASTPVINKAIKREDVANEYADKCRQHADDVELVPLYAAPPAPQPLDESLRKDAERYNTVRRMSVPLFTDAFVLNRRTGKPFDEIIDDLRPFMFPTTKP